MFGFFRSKYEKIKGALSKTEKALTSRIRSLLGKPWDEKTFDELEQILFESDLGASCAHAFVEHLRSKLRLKPTDDLNIILNLLKQEALEILTAKPLPPVDLTVKPRVILIVGVNGSGKTTSIAKLSSHFQKEGKKVLLAAGDTFRAAAVEQLELWAKRLGIEIVKSQLGSDPAAVVFDALRAAQTRGSDLVFIDTAGRLQNKTDLMEELKKMRSVCAKCIPGSPHETWLVLDATTGQNALDQAKTFHQFTPLSGMILSKLDGSAKGGIILPLYKQESIPLLFVGTGEGIEDLEPFDPITYTEALFGQGSAL